MCETSVGECSLFVGVEDGNARNSFAVAVEDDDGFRGECNSTTESDGFLGDGDSTSILVCSSTRSGNSSSSAVCETTELLLCFFGPLGARLAHRCTPAALASPKLRFPENICHA